ncbi:LLM class flavin-dependent oxidoreductase [Chryseobacterium potabilaquae]|nr:LLM class flavin-dependent oxidoreductase [Chryseobacterium potabilaquae]
MSKKMHLNCHIVGVGQNPAAWRTNEDPKAFINPQFYEETAIIAERGMFDAVFFSDSLSLHGHAQGPSQMLDPLIVSASILKVTEYIGLISTISTTFSDPFILARQLITLDHLSHGRIGWNAVTSYNPMAAKNFGKIELPSSKKRYERAEEFIEVVTKLNDSWSEDALIADAENGVFVDVSKVKSINHEGNYYNVAGPLNVPRSPQGKPVMVQSGASQEGLELAAKFADVVFNAQNSFQEAKIFYENLKSMVILKNRSRDSLKILPGLYPIIGSTLAEAKERKEKMDNLRNLDVDIITLGRQLGIEPSELKLNELLPYDLIEKASKDIISNGFRTQIVGLARKENLTVRELILNNFGMIRTIVGTPDMIADDMETWFKGGAADGFNLNFDSFPTGLEDMVEHVIPILQKRGLFRKEYTERTLRERFEA